MADVAQLAAQILAGLVAIPGIHDKKNDEVLVSWACELARDIVEQTKRERPAGDVPRLEVGTSWWFYLRVRGIVVDRDDAHGLCYELALEQGDFSTGRTVSVDASEVVDIDDPRA